MYISDYIYSYTSTLSNLYVSNTKVDIFLNNITYVVSSINTAKK